MGGLGNQLFQYAAGVLQALVTHGKLYLQKAELTHDSHDYRDVLFTLGEKYNTNLPNHTTLYQEDGFKPWNPYDNRYPNLLLYGYFQNYSVLSPILPSFKTHILSNLKQHYTIKPNSGFIHVRRGDYLKVGFNMKDTSYYTKALEYFKTIPHWYIFSDDIQWCKESKLFDTIHVTYVEESDALKSLTMMSQIRGAAIIANSTFSWWGAYLGCGIYNVVYPKIWFNNTTPDLFPEEWMGL
jgi:hypothetical protein